MPMLKPSKCSKLTTSRPNAFGLPRIKTCPGRTPVCEEKCYTDKFEKMYPGVLPVLETNLFHCTWMLNTLGPKMLASDFVDMVGTNREFRIHWDGDFFSEDYTHAWRHAIELMSDVRFWAYTRSFEFVPILANLPNLRLYLSLDKDNWEEGLRCWYVNPWVLLSTMGHDDWEFCDGRLIDPDGTRLRMFDCPAVNGKLKGVKGACQKCRVCVDSQSRNVVNFPLHR
jgi:hypothetical protein